MNSCKTGENIIPAELIDKWSRGVVQVSPIFKDESKHRYLPYEVAEMAIMFYSGVGDIVLDPFSGVGCALLTAVKFKRRFVCFERDKQEVKLFLDGLRVSWELFEKANKEAESGYFNILCLILSCYADPDHLLYCISSTLLNSRTKCQSSVPAGE